MVTTTRRAAVELDLLLEQVLEQVLWCWLCGDDRVFVPPLGEHPSADPRSERLCAECGSAVLVDVRHHQRDADQARRELVRDSA